MISKLSLMKKSNDKQAVPNFFRLGHSSDLNEIPSARHTLVNPHQPSFSALYVTPPFSSLPLVKDQSHASQRHSSF